MSGITGSLPPEYSTLTQLDTFSVSYTGVSGTLPPQVRAGIGGKMPGPCACSLLPSACMLANIPSQPQANRPLPPSLPCLQWSRLVDLNTLNVSNTAVAGTLPPQYSTLTQLNVLSISDTGISGTIPAQYSVLAALGTLDAASAQLTGTVPNW